MASVQTAIFNFFHVFFKIYRKKMNFFFLSVEKSNPDNAKKNRQTAVLFLI